MHAEKLATTSVKPSRAKRFKRYSPFVSYAISGAAGGALVGSAFGPVAAVIGAVALGVANSASRLKKKASVDA